MGACFSIRSKAIHDSGHRHEVRLATPISHSHSGAIMVLARFLAGAALALTLAAPAPRAQAFSTFADEDRAPELASQPAHLRYQFNTPTTVTYDRDSLVQGSTSGRIYVADMGAHRIRVLDLSGRLIGNLDDADTTLAADSPAAAAPQITAPLGIAFVARSEVDDDRLAGLYVNDVGVNKIHFYRTDSADPDTFYYVQSFGQPGSGAGEQLSMPRNLVVTPQGFIYVADEFNNRIKAFRMNPDAGYGVTLLASYGWQDNGRHVGAGPIVPCVDRDYGADSTYYDDYADSPAKRDGFRIPQGLTYYAAASGETYLYATDNGNNRIKIYRIDPHTGTLSLHDILGRYRRNGVADHLKRPRGVRTDAAGNLYVADSFSGRLIKFDNLAAAGASPAVRYRASASADAAATWVYGRSGAHQVEMRSASTALTEDQAFLLPNDLVPLVLADGSIYRENIWSWGYYFSNAQVMLVSDTGNHRVKKCWASADGQTLLRCSVSQGVGGAAAHEFWGYPRTLPGQLHAVGGMAYLSGSNRLLVSDTSNSVINMYSADGNYLGRFPGTGISYGVTGIATFHDRRWGESVAVLVASDITLPWPYSGDSALRIYDAAGTLRETLNLSYRTGGLSAPKIAYGSGNHPVALSVRSRSDYLHEIYIGSAGDYLWRFDYNSSSRALTRQWVSGGRDPTKGSDAGDNWALGPNFHGQGAPGTFDEIQGVLALGQRVYAVDRRNQRIQAFATGNGARLGQIGAGSGVYDHPDGLSGDDFFLAVGLAFDPAQNAMLVADGYNMVTRAFDNPDLWPVGADGRIRPTVLGHWLEPALGSRPGGLFSAQQAVVGNGKVYVHSLISNRITAFDWLELAQ